MLNGISTAATDLGLGGMLAQQRDDETDDERKRRMLGMSPAARNSTAAQMLFGYGPAGVAAGPMLGLSGGRRF